MKFEYRSVNNIYVDSCVTSVVSSGEGIMVFTSDYGPEHHKYLITGNTLRRYELTCSFFRVLPIQAWRVTA